MWSGHEGMTAAYFAIYTIASFAIGTGWVLAELVNGYFIAAITLCWLAWFSVFRPSPLPSE